MIKVIKPDVSFGYYFNVFNCGQQGKIKQADFDKYIALAFREIDAFCSYPCVVEESQREMIKLCACELAEMLYCAETSGNVKSESIDGYSVTYSDKKDVEKELRRIIVKRLANLGVLFAGV